MSATGVAEKGKFDARFEISAPGGHSSIPPEHTVRPMSTPQCAQSLNLIRLSEHRHARYGNQAA